MSEDSAEMEGRLASMMENLTRSATTRGWMQAAAFLLNAGHREAAECLASEAAVRFDLAPLTAEGKI